MDVRKHNRLAWNAFVQQGIRWTQPVSSKAVDQARHGKLQLLLTPTKPVPDQWLPDLKSTRTLCLASSGGQQGPLLAAAGADVTVFDNSPEQLAQDRFVAERDRLSIELIEGDMADLSMFGRESFDLIFHPCSNCFVPQIQPVWNECHRVLRPAGILLAGFTNPVRYIFDDERKENGNLEVCYSLPYSDLIDLSPKELQRVVDSNLPLEFGHTLENQIGGQLDAGLVLTGLYEDRFPDHDNDPLSRFMATFIATRACKP